MIRFSFLGSLDVLDGGVIVGGTLASGKEDLGRRRRRSRVPITTEILDHTRELFNGFTVQH